ncbi:MAG: hypothetical protein IMZ70_02285 [Candidatus Atribacteria bacterium]|nr:hypothetical protein [Candidatus Atribacteria bacterium]
MNKENIGAKEIDNIINNKSGILGLEKEITYNDSLGERLISSGSCKVPVCIVKVNEELVIARETYYLVKS